MVAMVSIQTAQSAQRNVAEDRPRERIQTGLPRTPSDSALGSNWGLFAVPGHAMKFGRVPQDHLPELFGSAMGNARFGQNYQIPGEGCPALHSEQDLHVRQEFRDRNRLWYISPNVQAYGLLITPTFSRNGDPCLLRAEVLLF
jgi:hypothetical protein